MFATPDKILDLDGMVRRCNAWRVRHDDLVFTHGSFEILHPAHTSYLEEARALGQRLIVGVYADEVKGSSVLSEEERSQLLASLLVVDGVVILRESTPDHALKAIRPQIVVDAVEAHSPKVSPDLVLELGARYVELVRPDLSKTQELLQLIRENQ